jgi:hypothetical protein
MLTHWVVCFVDENRPPLGQKKHEHIKKIKSKCNQSGMS